MRTLFALLFGASMAIFVFRADQAGRNGTVLQTRRLGWLALFGYLHFLLLWDGDILFLYAVIGLAALAFLRAPPLPLALAALLLFGFWQSWSALIRAPSAEAESAVAMGHATPGQQALHASIADEMRRRDADLTRQAMAGWSDQVMTRLTVRWDQPIVMVALNAGEIFAMMAIGIALLASGFFHGGWSRRALCWLAIAGIGFGGGTTLAFVIWAVDAGYPEITMQLAIHALLGFPHLAMALGYAALLVLAAPVMLRSRIGKRIEAAGRMALSNYIATSVVMGALAFGWGFGLHGRYGAAANWLAVIAVWVLLLGWSKPWLTRFRQGPLEWLWRSLTEWRMLPLRA